MCKATTSNGKPCPNQCVGMHCRNLSRKRADEDFCGIHLPSMRRPKEVDDLEEVKDCPPRQSMYVEGGKYCTSSGTVFEWRNGKLGCTKCDFTTTSCGNLASHKKVHHRIEKLDMKRKETRDCTVCRKETPKPDFVKGSGHCSKCRHDAYRKKNPKRKTCRCGSTTHMRTVSMNCPLNPNRDNIIKQHKISKENSYKKRFEKVKCDKCGVSVTKRNMAAHKKSQKCSNLIVAV